MAMALSVATVASIGAAIFVTADRSAPASLSSQEFSGSANSTLSLEAPALNIADVAKRMDAEAKSAHTKPSQIELP